MGIMINGKPYDADKPTKRVTRRVEDNRSHVEKMRDALAAFSRNLSSINNTTLSEDGNDLRVFGVERTEADEFRVVTNRAGSSISEAEVERLATGTDCVAVRKEDSAVFFRLKDDVKAD